MKQPFNQHTKGSTPLFVNAIICAILLTTFTGIAHAQNLKLKRGQKFSYEMLDDHKWESNNGSSKSFQYRRFNYEVVGTEGDKYVIKVSPQQFLQNDFNGRVYDSSIPFNEQENEESAIVAMAASKLSYTIVIDKAGKLVTVRDTAGMQSLITDKLKERNTLNVKHHNIYNSYSGQRPNYIETFIRNSASVFKAGGKANDNIKKIPSGADVVLKKDITTGLVASLAKDSSVKKMFADTNQYDELHDINKLQMVKKGALPLLAEAGKKLNYADYYSDINKAKRKIDDLMDTRLLAKGVQGIDEQTQRGLDSLDKQYGLTDNLEYLGAKLNVLAYMGGDQYYQIMDKVSYQHLSKDHLIDSKLGRELERGKVEDLKPALQILFTKMLSGKKYPLNINNLSDDIHDNLAKQVRDAQDPATVKRVLDAIKETEQLRNYAVNEMLAGLKTYCQVKLTTDQDQLAKLMTVNNNSLYDKAGRYRTLIYDELVKKQVPDSLLTAYNDHTIEMVKGNIADINSGAMPGVSEFTLKYNLTPRKIFYKKYLSDAYYRKSLLNKDRAIPFLQMAVDYLPTQQDLITNRYGYEKENKFIPSKPYKELYMQAAESGAISPDQLLKQYVDLVIIEPERYNTLKEKYAKAFPGGDFKKFFNDALKEKLPATPDFNLKERLGTQMAMKDQKDKFTFVDFWGTWCGACVAEIHTVEALYKTGFAPEKLSVTTIACFDKKKNVDDFMEAKKFTYPVLMSDGKVEVDFKIRSYPTKLLLLPNGTYVDIPFFSDYKPIVEKYLQWEI